MFFGHLALLFAAFFTGAAFYIIFAEQPARLKLEASQLLTQWIPSYKRGFMMQAPLAVLSGGSGLVAFYLLKDWRWVAGGCLILANWPFTLFIMMPINKELAATPPAQAGAQTVKSIMKWGSLHTVRTVLGTAATGFFLWALQ